MESNTERLNDVYDFLNYKHIVKNQEEFANKLGTSRPNVTNMLRGNVKVSDQILRKVYSAFPGVFSLDWLMTGYGPMLEGDAQDSVKVVRDEEPRTLDQSSLINAALAAKDETIKSKDAYISHLEETIAHLKSEVEFLRRTMQTSHIHTTFPIGVAEDDEKPSLYTPPFPQSPK